jgi:N-acetylmuramoyl-L-alanine amidase
MNIVPKSCGSRNFKIGRDSQKVEAIVIHIIEGSQTSCDNTFANNTLSSVRSAHYSVGKNGAIHQYVQEGDSAFHAGKIVNATWTGLKKSPSGTFLNPNLYTIGIEHEGFASDEWTQQMYESSSQLMKAIALRHGLEILTLGVNVVPHRDIRSDKTCPGFKVDLNRLVAMANSKQIDPVKPNLRITQNVNVRKNLPSAQAPILRVLTANQEIAAIKKGITGEPISGIDIWHEVTTGEFIWGGAAEEI